MGGGGCVPSVLQDVFGKLSHCKPGLYHEAPTARKLIEDSE